MEKRNRVWEHDDGAGALLCHCSERTLELVRTAHSHGLNLQL